MNSINKLSWLLSLNLLLYIYCLLKLIPSVLKLHHVFMIIWIHILHLSELIDVLKYGEHGYFTMLCSSSRGKSKCFNLSFTNFHISFYFIVCFKFQRNVKSVKVLISPDKTTKSLDIYNQEIIVSALLSHWFGRKERKTCLFVS